MDSGSESHESAQTTWHLNIATRKQLRQFLKEIQPDFLHVVDPQESGLVDMLYGAELLTETDHESLSGKDVHTRKDQARKLWFLLNKMSVPTFLSIVAPLLLEHFPHIIPEKFLTQKVVDSTGSDGHKYCLHHDIKGRIRAVTMADLLYKHDLLGFEDYEDIASEQFEADLVWTKMFDSCHTDDQSSRSELVEGLRAVLEKYKVEVPENLEQLVACGIPCTCRVGPSALPAPSPLPLHKVGSWIRKSPFGRGSPRSSGSSYSRMDLKSYSGATSIHDDDSQSHSSEVPDLMTTFPAPQGYTSECFENLSPVQEEGEEPSLLSSISEPSAEEIQPSADSEDHIIRNSCTDSRGLSHELELDANGQAISLLSLDPDCKTECTGVEKSELSCKSADVETDCIPVNELDHNKPLAEIYQHEKKTERMPWVDIFRHNWLTISLLMITSIFSTVALFLIGFNNTGYVTPEFVVAVRYILLNHEERLTGLQNITIAFQTAILKLRKF